MSKTDEFLKRCEKFRLKKDMQITFIGTMQNNIEGLLPPTIIDIKPQTIEEFAATYFDSPIQAAYFIATARHNNRLNNEPA